MLSLISQRRLTNDDYISWSVLYWVNFRALINSRRRCSIVGVSFSPFILVVTDSIVKETFSMVNLIWLHGCTLAGVAYWVPDDEDI
jgi:hypothetical protein